MRLTDSGIYLRSTAVCLGEATPVHRTEGSRTGQTTVRVSRDPGVVLARCAARHAATRADVSAVDAVFYSYAWHPGLDVWAPAAYVADGLSHEWGFPMATHMGCAGALATLSLACACLSADKDLRSAVVAAGDAWHEPWVDRYRATPGFIFGDGAGAVVVARERGFAQVLSVVTRTDTGLEGMNRGTEEWGPLRPERGHIDMQERYHAYVSANGGEDAVWLRRDEGLRAAVDRALTEGDTSLESIAWTVVPNIGEPLLQREFLTQLGVRVQRTTGEWGLTVGHLGAADPLAGLDHLVTNGLVEEGERVLVLMAGAGYTHGAMIVEIAADISALLERIEAEPTADAWHDDEWVRREGK